MDKRTGTNNRMAEEDLVMKSQRKVTGSLLVSGAAKRVYGAIWRVEQREKDSRTQSRLCGPAEEGVIHAGVKMQPR